MNNFELLFGTRVVVLWKHEVGDPKRKHKKKRIAKKWLKRYGVWEEWEWACPKGQVIYVDGTLYVSRRMYIWMKQYASQYHPPKFKVAHHGNNFARIRYDI